MDVRRHVITGEPILFAPERAGRPNAFDRDDGGTCPFCPGHENETPPAVELVGDPWRIRVFPNKYPAAAGHEVIVESARHDDLFETLDHPVEVVQTWIERYRAHDGAAYVSLFKNEGERAGASLEHIHSQVLPLPFVPPRAQAHIDAFTSATICPLCAAIETHRRDGLITATNETFVAFAPAGSEHAYEQWIVPARHQSEMTSLQEPEIADLASILQRSTAAARTIARAQNVIVMNFRNAPAAHLYLQVIPRTTPVAGFELGSGTFIDVVDPASAALRLRQAGAHQEPTSPAKV